jgi:predicted transcriptional regulator
MLDEETRMKIAYVGKASDKPEAHLLVEAVRSYADEREQYVRAVREGLEDVEKGKVTPHRELIRELESRLADLDKQSQM